jgi:hypothetical protein
MNDKMVNGVVGGAVVEVDRRESESKGCDVFYPFDLAPPGVYTYVLWCVDRGRHSIFHSWPTKSELRCAYYGRNKARIFNGAIDSANLKKFTLNQLHLLAK